MKDKLITVDRSEAVFLVPTDKKILSYNIPASSITRIQFDKCPGQKFGFIPVESEKITIVSPKCGEPLVYTKDKNKKFFDEYKADLLQFAKNNHITCYDNTK